jgi:predicted Fe-Mo cluster-binding NifX family protein
MKDTEKLVTVARYEDYVKADLARQLLEDEGIKAVVTGQNAANAYSGVPAVADIELQTLESQAEEARQVLEDADRQVSGEGPDFEEEDWSEDQDGPQE